MTSVVARAATPMDEIVDGYLDAFADLDPISATYLGIAGHDADLPDLSPDGLAEMAALGQRTRAVVAATTALDPTDRITQAAALEAFDLAAQMRAAGADESRLNNIDSHVQNLRQAFDLMPTATIDDWATVATRLTKLPDAIAGYIASLRLAASRGDISPRRQVLAATIQSQANVGDQGFFATFVAGAPGELPASLRSDLDEAAVIASDAYAELARYLDGELLAQAPERDAIGIERYALYSRSFVGTTLDLAEAYAWGLEEVALISAQMRATAERIQPGASSAEAIAFLDRDPARQLHGTDALQAWMQTKSDEAVAALADVHFDIPEPIRTLECRISPTHEGGIYYTGPSDDFTRPGRMWWSVPEDVTTFSTWSQLTTVYHEGVPGHHLQIAQTVYRRELLNRWRRLASWTSGHGEGWALYAEKLMADLGFLDDPADFLGMLSGQSMRAARVVLDIGIHCGFSAPAEVGGGEWTYDKAWQYLTTYSAMPHAILRFELDRYLGWPGQAPSYKIGERFWLQLRDDVRASEGAAFDLKAFHRRALDIGGVSLDVLRTAVLGGYDQP
jgi:uncharacterized protein (DUF885 family)